jgi:DNA-binding winged helix-turn-helix (wHTH) protein
VDIHDPAADSSVQSRSFGNNNPGTLNDRPDYTSTTPGNASLLKPLQPLGDLRMGVVMASKSFVFRFADIEVREREYALVRAGEVLSVEPKAFRVLLILLRNPQKLIAKEELMNAVWGDATVTENSLTRSIAVLRKALGDDTQKPRYIETVATVGYRFLRPVETREDPAGEHEIATGESAGDPKTALPRRGYRKRLPAIAVAAVVLVSTAGFVFWHNLSRVPKVTKVVQLTSDAKAKSSRNLPVTDGVHVYFVEGIPEAGGSGIAQISAAGGETSQLQTQLREISAIYDIAPSFSELLVGKGVGAPPDPATGRAGGALEVWILPLPGGTPHRVGNFRATSACYTPDGTQILYADGRSFITSIGMGVILANWRRCKDRPGACAIRPTAIGFVLTSSRDHG